MSITDKSPLADINARLPTALRGVFPFLVALPLLAIVQLATRESPFFVILSLAVGVNVILAVSLNIVNGMTGQFSIGHAGFMAVGAYVGGITSKALSQYGLSFLPAGVSDQVMFSVSLLVGGSVAALFGFLVGLPSLRLKGDYLAIVTLGFGEIIRVVVQNTEQFGRALGLGGVPQWTTLFSCWLVVFTVILLARRVASSTHGRALLAIREDEVAAEAMGVNTTGYKVRAFVVAAFFAGLAGGVFAHYQSIVSPGSFTFVKSMEIVVMIVAGGLGSTSGAVIAAVVLTLLPEAIRSLFLALGASSELAQRVDQARMPVYGILLVLIMLLRPRGLFGRHEIWDFGKRGDDELRRLRREARDNAADPVTGTLAPRRLLDVLRREWAAARRYRHPLSVAVVGVQGLPALNASLGRARSEQVLRSVAGAIAGSVREVDACGRTADDAFTLLLPHTAADSAVVVAERIVARLEPALAALDGDFSSVKLAIGIASTGDTSLKNAEELSAAAERARRQAATEGKSNVIVAQAGEMAVSAPEPTRTVGANALDARVCTMQFGGLTALSSFSLSVSSGELKGLIGPNGAGKTTAFNVLTGVYRPTSGDVVVDGVRVNGRKTHQINRAGLARTFQNIRLFKELTALDNVKVACPTESTPFFPRPVIEDLRKNGRTNTAFVLDACGNYLDWWRCFLQTPGFLREEERIDQRARELLDVMGLGHRADEQAKNLPYGEQRRLEIARALATGPKVLLLDEPAAGMNTREKADLMVLIRKIRDDFGLGILLIEHDMKLVMGICETITVLDHGETIARGTPEQVKLDPKVIEAYLGVESKDLTA